MRPLFLFVLVFLLTAAAGWSQSSSFWDSRMGRGDGTLEAASFRVERKATDAGATITTVMPARGRVLSSAAVELDGSGQLIRSRTDYTDPELAEWYRADVLFTEVQRGAGSGGGDNLAFQRAWKNQVQEAKNLAWGPNFVEFSTLPFILEKRLSSGKMETWQFQTYSNDIPGTMQVSIRTTNRPLEAETRYRYPRWLRERLGTRTVLLVELTAIGDFKGAYPFPFYYAFTAGSRPEWLAAWGGNPQATSFQWRQ